MFKMNYPYQLTNREFEVLQLMAEGCSNKKIAGELCLTVRTVKFHSGNIYEKLGINSRSEAIIWAWKHREIKYLVED